MPKDPNHALREHLLELLKGGQAHATFDDAVKNLPAKLQGAKPENLPHSPWMLLEHLRITQHDILEFSRNEKHESPKWPEGYWPNETAPASAAAWDKSVKQFHADLKAMQDL
ncbi:MAG TPA: DinB family protein, partial [Candidatus Sulfotelmatobacter sp.]|nr:DinB family protein [Candidatus Sulfotelmatobacter sp.]